MKANNRTKFFYILLVGLISMVLLAVRDPVGREDLVYTHEYFLRYDFQFKLGKYSIHAVRYADVESSKGKYKNFRIIESREEDRILRRCDRSKPECWDTGDHFLIAVPNGDIVDIAFDKLGMALPDIRPNASFNTVGVIDTIERDKIGSPSSFQPQNVAYCTVLDKSEVIKTYGKDISLQSDEDINAMHVEAKVTRMDDPSIKLDDASMQGDSCKANIAKSSERVTVTEDATK